MEKDNDSMESDPYKSQGLRLDIDSRDISHNFKNYIYGHVKVSTGKQKTFCN